MNEDDILALENTEYRQRLFQEVLTRCEHNSKKYVVRSKFYRLLNISMIMLTIIVGSVIGVLLAVEVQNYLLASLSFGITFIQLIHQGFKIGTLGIHYRYAGFQISKLKRMLVQKVRSGSDIDEIDTIVDFINDELDELSYSLFSQSYGPSSIRYNQDAELDLGDDPVEPIMHNDEEEQI